MAVIYKEYIQYTVEYTYNTLHLVRGLYLVIETKQATVLECFKAFKYRLKFAEINLKLRFY